MINKRISFPVGRVEYLALRPCSFGEFLNALGEFSLQEALQEAALPEAIHPHVMKLFNEYVLVGGMPEAVSFYAETKDLVALQNVYETLLNGYRDDVEKYAPNAAIKNVLRHILAYGWQYAGQRIKFERFANSNYKSREMAEAFRTLEKTMLLELSYPVTGTKPPVLPDLKKSPKLLWLDTGLVNYSAKLQTELFGTADISESWKGKIAEHIVGQGLLSASDLVSAKRNFWVREARNSQAEVDYVFQYNGQLIPIEVKSGDNAKLKSLHLYMEESGGTLAVRFWNNSVSVDTVKLSSGEAYTLCNLPFYYAGYLGAIMKILGLI
jgi:predicted AAA+ superfamily ATPase